jgi:hypothetical protein
MGIEYIALFEETRNTLEFLWGRDLKVAICE